MVSSSLDDFQAAVRDYRFDRFGFDDEALALARTSHAETGLLVLGEPHGAYETPAAVYELVVELDARGVAFEWSHEELDDVVQFFVRGGSFDFDRLWSLPPTAEFFCGDGRITAGHFALLQRLRDEGRLDQVILFDRLDPDPHPGDWRIRDREMAERFSAEWDDRVPLVVLTGAFHATLEAKLDPDGETMAAHLARNRPGLRPAMLQYDQAAPMPTAPITFRLPEPTLAVVPGHAATSLQSVAEAAT